MIPNRKPITISIFDIKEDFITDLLIFYPPKISELLDLKNKNEY